MFARSLFLAVSVLALSACGPSEPVSEGAPPDMRRLTEEQYRNTIVDVFGSTVTYGGRFDPLERKDGLTELGARSARVTPSGIEQYYTVARTIAAQVVSGENRDILFPCKPADAKTADDACAKQFFTETGRMLFRRALTTKELEMSVSAAHEVGAGRNDFYEGIAYSLAGMMVTPKFLFVIDSVEPDPKKPGDVRLTAYARASRLSFLLWNSTPDDQLLKAAEAGELDKKSSLEKQVDRMIASPKLDNGVRAFFADFLDLGRFEILEKDPVIYPAFGVKAGEDAKEQLLRTIADHLVARDLDYRDLFTTRHTFVTAPLARIYKVPVTKPDGGWAPYEFAEGDPRAGILTMIGFLSVNSHPGTSSPTLRGRAIRETVLCQKVPDPPGDVDFSGFNDPNSPNKTQRQRLTAHRANPTCAGCHKITDPIGLSLENFDGAGAFRTTENGVKIDTAGDLDGVPFTDAPGLAKAMSTSPAVPACLVSRLYSYATGRPLDRADKDTVAYFQKTFESDGYRMSKLLRQIAISESLYSVSPPKAGAATQAKSSDAQKENPS